MLAANITEHKVIHGPWNAPQALDFKTCLFCSSVAQWHTGRDFHCSKTIKMMTGHLKQSNASSPPALIQYTCWCNVLYGDVPAWASEGFLLVTVYAKFNLAFYVWIKHLLVLSICWRFVPSDNTSSCFLHVFKAHLVITKLGSSGLMCLPATRKLFIDELK